MQVIGPTFRAYAGRFLNTGPFSYGTSTNPLANIYASIMYTLSRYRTLSAWGRPGGYAKGGVPPVGRPFWVGEDEPELMVLGRGTRAHVTPGAQARGGQVVNHYHLDRSMSTPEVVMEMRRQLALAVA
jgi:SLT domain-containing protein